MLKSFDHGLGAIRREEDIATTATFRQNNRFICADWLMSDNEADITGCRIEKIAVLYKTVRIKLVNQISVDCPAY